MSAAIEAPIDVAAERAAVLERARVWLGTPFHHGARLHGVGVDCAQLLAAVYAPLVDPGPIASYPPDWYLHRDSDRLREVLRRSCCIVERLTPGDILTFRFGRAVSHAGILLDATHFLHAVPARMVEIESWGPASPYTARLAEAWTLTRWAAP